MNIPEHSHFKTCKDTFNMSTLFVLMLCFLALAERHSPVCALDCEIVSWKSPPYIYNEGISANVSNETKGIVEYFVGAARKKCFCNLTFMPMMKDYATFMSYVNGDGPYTFRKSSLRIFLPAYKTSVIPKQYFFGHVGIVKSPGMTLVGNGFFKSKLYQLAVTGSRNAATFFIIMILAMIDVGIIIWICVSITKIQIFYLAFVNVNNYC